MSDNFGPNQTRVIDSSNRSFESVIYQFKKPPLSSEVNFTGTLSSDHAREVSQSVMPSGWEVVGNIFDNAVETDRTAGDVICSPNYKQWDAVNMVWTGNRFKLIALDKGVEAQKLAAWVNGHRLVVQGTNCISTTDENNMIEIDAPSTIAYRVDFVFLEVWRQLITPTDVVYKHGNFLYGGINPDNDLIDPVANIETSLRVQVQYRIRSASCDLQTYPDGFDPFRVFAQAALPNPLSTTLANFLPVPGDPGLWRAGLGDQASQNTFGTVDGYVYAIPMFAIQRRNTSAYDPDIRSNGAGKSLNDYLNGYASDRPDSLYSDWVVANDILDMRHMVSANLSLQESCDMAFSRLINGELRGTMVKSTLGEDHIAVVLTQADAVEQQFVDHPGTSKIAVGDGLRRVFSNAQIDQPDTLQVFTKVGAWAPGDFLPLNIGLTNYPPGTAYQSVQGLWSDGTQMTAGVDYIVPSLPSSNTQVDVTGGLMGKVTPIILDYTIEFPAGPYGLTQLPTGFYEARNEDATMSIPLISDGIRLRQAAPVVATDGTHFDMLYNNGALDTEPFNFGVQMVYHALGTGIQQVTFPRVINGYPIIGVVNTDVAGTYRSVTDTTRDANNYTVTLAAPAVPVGTDVQLTLYVGGKFFEMNKQGRAIVDTFEMRELVPLQAANGARTQFTLDSTNQEIISIASNSAANGLGIAYVNGDQKTLLTNNFSLPTDQTSARAVITFSNADTPVAGALIQVPVLMHGAISGTENYAFFYETVPYQGVLDSTATGSVELTGPAIVTTAGSGAITNYAYSVGLAQFNDSTVVNGSGTNWLVGARAGYLIECDTTHQTQQYLISEVLDDNTILLETSTNFATIGAVAYTIRSNDLSNNPPSNIVDRLPTLDANNDSACRSESIGSVGDAYPVLTTRIVSPVQDIINRKPDGVTIGSGAAARGRATVQVSGAIYGSGTLGLKFERLSSIGNWQKTYQSYVFNKDDSGRLYLMVVSSESDGQSQSRYLNHMAPANQQDTVDIFEIPGRPLTTKRPV